MNAKLKEMLSYVRDRKVPKRIQVELIDRAQAKRNRRAQRPQGRA